MVNRHAAQCLCLCMACAWTGLTAESDLKERAFEGFLYAGSDGHVWLGTTMVTLGMWGTEGGITQYRLSPDLARRAAPLVNRIGDLRDSRRIYTYMPFLRGQDTLEKTPTILVRLHGRYRLAGKRERKMPGEWSFTERTTTYEITSARFLDAEFLSGEWLLGWRRLDESLREIVAASLEPPGAGKRQRLAEAIEKGSLALNAMAKATSSQQGQGAVRRVEPKARVVRRFQRGHGRGVRGWREQFERYVSRLRIQPRTPLPPQRGEPPVLEWLAEMRSVRRIVADVKRSGGEDGLDASVLYLPSARRMVYVWELADLTAAQLEEARAKAMSELADRRRRAQRPGTPEPAQSRDVPKLGIVAAAPGDNLMAEKLILGGILVEKRLPGGAAVGLQEGDIILNYRRVYDLVMGAFDAQRALAQFANRYRHARKIELRVLRGGRIVTIKAGG